MGLGRNAPDGGSRHYQWFNLHDQDSESMPLDNTVLASGVVLLRNERENKKRYPYYPEVFEDNLVKIGYSAQVVQETELTIPTIAESIEQVAYNHKPSDRSFPAKARLTKEVISTSTSAPIKRSTFKESSQEPIKDSAQSQKTIVKSEKEQDQIRETRKRKRLAKKLKGNSERRERHLREKKFVNIANLWEPNSRKRILLIDADNFTGHESDMIIYMAIISSLAEEADFAFLAGQASVVKRLSRFIVGDHIEIKVVEKGKDLADKFLINSAIGISSKAGYDYVVASNDHIFAKLLKGDGRRLTILSPDVESMSLHLLSSANRIFDMKTLSTKNIELGSEAEVAILNSIKEISAKKASKSPKKGSPRSIVAKPEVHSSRKHGNKSSHRIREKSRILEEELDDMIASAQYRDFASGL